MRMLVESYGSIVVACVGGLAAGIGHSFGAAVLLHARHSW